MSDIAKPQTLADLRRLLATLPGPGAEAAAAAAQREPQLTKPAGSLGRLEDLAAWTATWQDRHPPTMARIGVRVFAGNHGVAARGVSAFPPEVTVQMVANFQAGGAAVNQLSKAIGADMRAVALDLDTPTADFTQAPAMVETAFLQAVTTGMENVEADLDLVCLGEMGIGNTTSAAAVCLALFGGTATDWTGPGTGVSGDALDAKTRVVAEGAAFHAEAAGDGLEILRRLGGRELAAIAGAVIGARLKRVPVMLDGFICTAAAAPLALAVPGLLDHCQVAHASAEPGHRRLIDALGKAPLLDLGLRLGEASGAVTAASLVRSAVACHTGMATFAEAGVSDKDG
ncbi:MAG: nicotinate-nucleotide--dimethylbenzimidazole phosphoribosyltransferase [Rhodobacterales bacterium]|nr:nicotinate-nucleotide--dimethylbenzimidazole phosphoribosyltransferase [Rhodobacterales bacterium]